MTDIDTLHNRAVINGLNLLIIKLFQPSLICSFSSLQITAFCDDTTTFSDQGTCGIDGKCQCDAGIIGDDCSEGKSIYNIE